MHKHLIGIVLASLSLTCSPVARAVTVVDAKGDFLPSYVGPHLDDLDVTSFSVAYDKTTTLFKLGATFAGAIDPASVGFYVIGANTGTGLIAPFASLGQGNVIFNQAIVIRKDGTGSIGQATLDPASITISGDSLSALIPLSLLPSTGFTPETYGFNIWPRIGLGQNSQITDFAPENATLAAVPEPATWTMILLGFGAVGAGLRRRKSALVGQPLAL